MRIAFIGQKGIPATYGGVERYVEELSTRLADRGHSVSVYSRRYYTQSRDKMYKGVMRIHTPTIRSKYLDTVVHTFTSIIHLAFVARKVDIVYVHSVGPSLLIPLIRILKPGAKVVAVFQSQDDKHDKWGPLAKRVLRLGSWVACHAPHATICSSKEIQAYAKSVLHADTHQIYNGAPEVKPYVANEIEKKFGIRRGEYFLMASRFVRHKNIHTAIESFKKLSTSKKLVIAGDSAMTDDYAKEVYEMAKSDDRIIFTGFVSGPLLWELYSKAYVSLHVSNAEGLSLSLLEAMSYGLGIIASDIQANREAVGNNAFFVQPESVDDLRQAMQHALQHPQEVFAQGGALKHRAQAVFSWDRITDQVEEVFLDVLREQEVPVLQSMKDIKN